MGGKARGERGEREDHEGSGASTERREAGWREGGKEEGLVRKKGGEGRASRHPINTHSAGVITGSAQTIHTEADGGRH